MLSREDFYMIKQLRQQGAYIVDIATQIGCSERTVRPVSYTHLAPFFRCVSTLWLAVLLRLRLHLSVLLWCTPQHMSLIHISYSHIQTLDSRKHEGLVTQYLKS